MHGEQIKALIRDALYVGWIWKKSAQDEGKKRGEASSD